MTRHGTVQSDTGEVEVGAWGVFFTSIPFPGQFI